MTIELSTQLIHASIAAILRDIDPNAEIFDNPTQQGTPYPAWYIVHRQPVERQRECGNRYMLVYGIDIWYMLQQNITRMYDQYTQVAERLQDVMEYLPIYGYPGVLIHTYENSWNLELNAMKYSITLRLRCSRNTMPETKMQVIEDLRVFIKGLGLLKRIHYTCSQFPDFDMGIETSEYCYEGKNIVLPFVSGVYRDTDNQRWEPIVWDKGPMGGTFGPVTSDTTINLIMGEIVGLDTCIGGTVGVGENVGHDVVWRVQGMTRDDWHYVGPERALGGEPVLGGADLTRAAYEPIGPQKWLAGAPVLGGTVEPYNPVPDTKFLYLSPRKIAVNIANPGMFGQGDTLYDEDGSVAYFTSDIPELIDIWSSSDSPPWSSDSFYVDQIQYIRLEKKSGNVAGLRDTHITNRYWIQRIEVTKYD